MELVDVSMASMGHYGIYGALLQTPIEGPGFADVSDCTTRIGIDATRLRIYENGREISGTETGSDRDIRALLDAVLDSLASLDLPSLRAYEPAPPHRGYASEDTGNEEGKNFHTLLDRMTTQKNINILADRFYPPAPPPKE